MNSRITPKHIRELMRLRGMSQAELAREMEVNESAVSRWLQGRQLSGPSRVLIRVLLQHARQEISPA